MLPSFLGLPQRPPKPRAVGITHVLDKGLGRTQAAELLEQAGHVIDIVKVGWGIGYVDPLLPMKAAACREADVLLCLGGTLLEIAAARRAVDEFREWALAAGVTMVEVSNGLGLLRRSEKTELITLLSRDFVVAAEVGSKDATKPVVAQEWAEEMLDDLAAGARWVVAEGRESGTVGIYSSDGQIRDQVVSVILEQIPLARIIFEAPNRAQQSWFIQSFGNSVNLGNVATDDVLPLETLRLGLRADSAWMSIPAPAARLEASL